MPLIVKHTHVEMEISKEEAFKKAVDLAVDTTKLIITLSTTIITLGVTVLKLFFSEIHSCSIVLLVASWVFFLISIIIGFLYILGITGRYALIGEGKTALAFKRLGINETANRQKFWGLLITFVLGILCLIMFGGSLYCGKKVDKQNQKNKTEVLRKQAIHINETNHIRRQWGNKK